MIYRLIISLYIIIFFEYEFFILTTSIDHMNKNAAQAIRIVKWRQSNEIAILSNRLIL